MAKNYYDILGVDKNATTDEIKKSYRKIAMKEHPDKGGDAEKFKEAAEAYDVLSNPQKKQEYDQFGSVGGSGGSFNMDDIYSQFGDIFGSFGNFGGFGNGGGRRRQRRGSNVRVRTKVSLNDILFGKSEEISYSRRKKCVTCDGKGGTGVKQCATCDGRGERIHVQNTPFGRIQSSEPCPVCHGEGQVVENACNTCHGEGTQGVIEKTTVHIPAGVATGMQLNIPDMGNFVRDGIAGDLHVEIEEVPNKEFKRDDHNNLHKEEYITIPDAILGASITVDTPQGKLNIKIPKGCPVGKTFEFKSKGVPNLGQDGRHHGSGNLYVSINVKIPSSLEDNEKQAIESLKNSKNFSIQK